MTHLTPIPTHTPATVQLLRALLALGPRLHQSLESVPATLYGVVCETLRDCGLDAYIARLDEDGTVRTVATTLSSEMLAMVEAMLGTSVIGYALPLTWPITAALEATDPVVVADVASVLAPFLPHLANEQRTALAQAIGLERAILAPILARTEAEGSQGVLAVWGPHGRLVDEDAPAVAAVAAHLGIALENARLAEQNEQARGALAAQLVAAEAARLAAEAATRQRDTFLSIAGHELRTPLTTAKVQAQMAARQLERLHAASARDAQLSAQVDRVRDHVERVERQLERQERLVNDLLDASRIQEGRLELRLMPSDLIAIVREGVEEQRLLEPLRTIALELPARRREVRVLADADRLSQVLTNYLTNALKYAPADTPIVVRVQVKQGMARVSVRDLGPGIPPAEQPRVWERFHRAPDIEPQDEAMTGLGLGLYISRAIVEQHHGQVGVESTPGQGATFWFALPLARTLAE